MRLHHHARRLVFLVRPGTTDVPIVDEVIVRDTYGASGQIRPGSVVVDVGAHIGSFAVFAASMGARVIAFEPATANFDLLLENIGLNGYDVEAHKLGIMDPGGPRNLYLREGNLGGCSFYTGRGPSEEVETITLKEAFDAHGVEACDFLKIDCEGAEYDILKDFPYFGRVGRVSLEYVGEERRRRIMGLLGGNGYEVTLRANERFGAIHGAR